MPKPHPGPLTSKRRTGYETTLRDLASEALSAPDAVLTVIGESLVDIVIDHKAETRTAHPGRSPLNVAVGYARLGLTANLVTHYADDQDGRLIDRYLQSNGVSIINGGTAATSTAPAAALNGLRAARGYI